MVLLLLFICKCTLAELSETSWSFLVYKWKCLSGFIIEMFLLFLLAWRSGFLLIAVWHLTVCVFWNAQIVDQNTLWKKKFLWDKLPALYGFLRLTSLHCSCNYHCCQLSWWSSSCRHWMSRSYLANNSGKTGIASPLHPWLELDHLLLWASVIRAIFTSTARQETVKVRPNPILTKQGIGFSVHCCEVHEHAPCNNGVLDHQVPYDGVLWLLQKLQLMIQNVGLVMQKWHGNGILPPVFDDEDCCDQSLGSFQLACKPTSLHLSKQKNATPPPSSW